MPKNVLFKAMEKAVAGMRVSWDSEFQMMPEDKYIKHVTETLTEGEGKLTRPQAEAQW